MEEKIFQKYKKSIAVISVIILIVFSVLVCWYIGRPMIKFVSQPEQFRDWIDSKGLLGMAIFIGMVVLQIVFAIIPGEPLEIGAGYAFGAFEATLLCVIGSLIGSTIVFAFVKTFGARLIEVFYPVEKINNLKFLKNSKKRDIIIFILFLLPGTPKDILTYFLGVVEIKPATFLIVTSIARLPSIVTSTIGGSALGSQNYVFAITVFVITMIISIIGISVYELICKHNAKKHS